MAGPLLFTKILYCFHTDFLQGCLELLIKGDDAPPFNRLCRCGNDCVAKIGEGGRPEGEKNSEISLLPHLYSRHGNEVAQHGIDGLFFRTVDPVHDKNEFGQDELMADKGAFQPGSGGEQRGNDFLLGGVTIRDKGDERVSVDDVLFHRYFSKRLSRADWMSAAISPAPVFTLPR